MRASAAPRGAVRAAASDGGRAARQPPQPSLPPHRRNAAAAPPRAAPPPPPRAAGERTHGVALPRRAALLAGVLAALQPRAASASAADAPPGPAPATAARPAGLVIRPARLQPELRPAKELWDYLGGPDADARLVEAQRLFQAALDARSVEEEERGWSELIRRVDADDAPWAPQLLARVRTNRGNARSRQGLLRESLDDYDAAMALAPYSVDPVLNRGVVLEQLGMWDEAVADYRAVLEVEPNDPIGWNNLGNAEIGLAQYGAAAEHYGRAAALSPEFAFASANRAVALFADGRRSEAIRAWRTLARRFPDFDEVRAALTAALWAEGLRDQAESEWLRVGDPRYADRTWLRTGRRWPPALVTAMESFQDLRA